MRSAWSRRSLLMAAPAAVAAARALAPEGRTSMGVATTCFMTARHPSNTLDFLEYAHSLGAGGIQAPLTSLDASDLRNLRQRLERYEMYLEVMAGLPGDEGKFEATAAAAKEAGALCVRTACLGGRRYENFADLDSWKQFVADSHAKVDRGLRVSEKARLPLALENHKDWTAGELAELIRRYGSPYLGVCLDTGNNISLLDDPADVIDRLAPYAISTHIKDMAVEEYPEGFLLAEVPLGDGILDMKTVVGKIRAARPSTRITLEMITRDPLKVPCLTGKYWATFPDRNGRYLAETLSMIRRRKPSQTLTYVEAMDHEAQVRLEEGNVKRCLAYARERLSLSV